MMGCFRCTGEVTAADVTEEAAPTEVDDSGNHGRGGWREGGDGIAVVNSDAEMLQREKGMGRKV